MNRLLVAVLVVASARMLGCATHGDVTAAPVGDDTQWSKVIGQVEERVAKAIPDEDAPLRKKLEVFKNDPALQRKAIEKCQERAKEKGREEVMKEIEKGLTEEELREVDRKLRGGVHTEQIGFPWCMLWGCA